MMRSFDVPFALKIFHLILLLAFISFTPFLIDKTGVLIVQGSMEMADEEGDLDRGNLGRHRNVSLGINLS